MLACRPAPGSDVGAVVGVEAVEDDAQLESPGLLDRPAVDLALAEVAAVGGVRRVARVLDLVGVDQEVARAELPRELLRGFTLLGGEAGRDGGQRHGLVAEDGDEAFPGHQNFNKQLTKFMEEGGKVYACRFALQALYGHGEPSLIPGIRPINPLDVLDLILLHRKDNAFILDTWTV